MTPTSTSTPTNRWSALHYATGEPVTVTAGGGRIVKLVPGGMAGGERKYIAPGLIDIQMNGFGGIDLNSMAVTPQRIIRLVRLMAEGGVTRFCPTVTTGTVERMRHSIRTIAEACETDPLVRYAVAGIHVEGPFISPEDGPRGAHGRHLVRDPDIEEYEAWQRLAGGRIVKVTLAPELPGALAFIRRLKADGVIAAIGHTSAAAEEIRAAVEAGVTLSTHLGNGAHPVLPRHPNYIWSQLADDRLWAGLIADGFHLPPSTLKVMILAKGEKAILTSDAVVWGGMPPGIYEREEGEAVVLEPNGFLHMKSTPGIMAGSAMPLHAGVANVVKLGIAGWPDAIKMAALHPARMLGLEAEGAGMLKEGGVADFFVYSLDAHGKMIVRETVAGGATVHSQRR
ncbi:MAG: amidohydrolase family protein [Paenibacillaceae bacterium]|nr:amidohydrolase family protein [Paenibacillaceae bacterium]